MYYLLFIKIYMFYLSGGLLSQVVTEISGESATGKTQICLQLCLTVQLPAGLGGLNSGTNCCFKYKSKSVFKHGLESLLSSTPSVVPPLSTDVAFWCKASRLRLTFKSWTELRILILCVFRKILSWYLHLNWANTVLSVIRMLYSLEPSFKSDS